MDVNQKFLISALSAAIGREKFEFSTEEEVDLEIVFECAKEHGICAMLYPVLKNLNEEKFRNYEVLSKWKDVAILSGVRQMRFINQMSNVFNVLNENNIDVIALKGLVLRELYPKPEFRTMSDADILIREKDMENTKKILINLGYYEDHTDSKHSEFSHKNHLPIEVHWLTMDKNYIKHSSYLEESMWENTGRAKMGEVLVKVPSLETQIVYLCLHMASHMVYSGFGIRQLCDLILLVEANENKINWNDVFKGLKMCKMVDFTTAIFQACNKLFKFKVPDVLYKYELEDNKYMEVFISCIFSGGVYGTANNELVNDNSPLDYEIFPKHGKDLSKLKYFMAYIFPSRGRLDDKYIYAKKHPVFLPIAWIHRLINAIFTREYSINEKNSVMNLNISILEKKTELLRWLDLK